MQNKQEETLCLKIFCSTIFNYFYRIKRGKKKIKKGLGENGHLLAQEINLKQYAGVDFYIVIIFLRRPEARLPAPPQVCAPFSTDREQAARMREKHLKQSLCIKGVCDSEERRKLHEQLMPLYETVRQLVETLTPGSPAAAAPGG